MQSRVSVPNNDRPAKRGRAESKDEEDEDEDEVDEKGKAVGVERSRG